MGCCCAPNCSNRPEKGVRMFKFPKHSERRQLWVTNCRRDQWNPSPYSQLCEKHFEENMFESNRCDGWKKLKPNAIPTIFSVSKPPGRKIPHQNEDTDSKPNNTHPECPDENLSTEYQLADSEDYGTLKDNNKKLKERNKMLKDEIKKLQDKVRKLNKRLETKDTNLAKFLTPEQIEVLGKEKQSKWSQAGIINGLKLRLSLGGMGYKYLIRSGYPAPSYSTLNRKIQHVDNRSQLSLLPVKSQTMEDHNYT